MKRESIYLASACVVCIAIGYFARGAGGDSPGDDQTEQEVSSPESPNFRPRDRSAGASNSDELLSNLLNGRSVKDLDSDELINLIAKLSKYDPLQDPVSRARQNYQLQLLLSRMSVTQLEQAVAMVSQKPENKRSEWYGLVQAYTAKDPSRAIEWAKTQPNASAVYSMVLMNMAKDNPGEASDLFHQAMLDGAIKRNDGWSAIHSIGAGMASLGADALFDFVDRLPSQQQSSVLGNVSKSLPESERLKMLEISYERSVDAGGQNSDFDSIFGQIASLDADVAESWLEKMEPGRDKANLELTRASNVLQGGDREKAEEWMKRAISQMPGKEIELLDQALSKFGWNNPEAVQIFTSLLPADVEIRAEHFEGRASNYMFNGFSGITDIARAIPDASEQAKFVIISLERYGQYSAVRGTNETDLQIMNRRIQDLGFTGDNAERVREALDKLKPNPR